ncbi:Hypothetical_protein [Hexamita inflata]|uniref:Hypothetical_protein n=1 Tax=Hexamita inflata TaxID=28002 RepID=A0ABP1I1W4_9EUKA
MGNYFVQTTYNLQQINSTLSNTQTQQSGQIATINSQISQIQQINSNQNSQITTLQTNTNSLSGQIGTLNSQISSLQQQINSLQTSVASISGSSLTGSCVNQGDCQSCNVCNNGTCVQLQHCYGNTASA